VPLAWKTADLVEEIVTRAGSLNLGVIHNGP
jgi:hypothetical protein